ncbi:Gfo/Idh/MocA family protein [Humisphaera borealis]|uniref:Gfo/Idh/MocA family oxidoreductase n=1 Tax=Humisphaera borealis TaxID=2807512 RepID=A0A7M2WQN1_9BACT|nr:Gfo/Idh/MocA family oxidoreductase [Humisphaera borealis]QOV87776.1 Gfo/Idh/MocA family oxidoreductase [Humisphaera borealis]
MSVRYGVVGCGAIAQRRHIPECVHNPNSTLVALCDPNAQRIDEISKAYGGVAKCYTDYAEMLKDPTVDAVVVSGPNSMHASQSIQALEAGKHVLCEKPMATTREDAKAMMAAAKKSGNYLMIALNQRLIPAHKRAKEIIDSGRLGKVLSFRTAFQHPGPESWSVDGGKSWFFQKGSAFMGVTGDLGVHKADLLRWLLGQEFVEVGGFISTLDKRDAAGKLIELDDNAFLKLKTDKGVLGSMILSWTNYGPEENYTIVFCEKGVLSIGTDPTYGVIVDYRNGEKELHKVGEIATNTRQVPSGVIDSFTECIRTSTPPSIDGREGYCSLDVILTAMDAGKEGRVMKILGC